MMMYAGCPPTSFYPFSVLARSANMSLSDHLRKCVSYSIIIMLEEI